jgi:hypothetical protein
MVTAREMMVLSKPPRQELDPLDLEILERAFDAAWAAFNGTGRPVEFDSDEGLEAILRRELIEIAYFNGVGDPETLRDMVLSKLPAWIGAVKSLGGFLGYLKPRGSRVAPSFIAFISGA